MIDSEIKSEVESVVSKPQGKKKTTPTPNPETKGGFVGFRCTMSRRSVNTVDAMAETYNLERGEIADIAIRYLEAHADKDAMKEIYKAIQSEKADSKF